MSAVAKTLNPLARGFYTVREAARLIEVGNSRRIAGWLKGYPGRKVSPLLCRDYEPIGKAQELSFYDLLEVRFVEFFREQGVGAPALRRALETAREVFGADKPLTSTNVKFRAESGVRDILVEEVLKPASEGGGGDPRLWSLINREYKIYEAIRRTLDAGVEFDPATQLAKLWRPRVESFPEIVVDPRIAYGQPTTPSQVPTSAIRDAWLAEGKDFRAVADWFEIPPEEVAVAVGFEERLDAHLRPN